MTREDFERIDGIVRGLDLPEGLVERLDSARRRLAAESFRLAFVGESGAGKSALANALSGIGALPTAVRPCTSVSTRVKWGETFDVSARLRTEPAGGGTSKAVTVRELTPFVTRLTARFAAQAGIVEEAVVRCPAPLLAGGLEILDLPALDILPAFRTPSFEAHAILVVLEALKPPSEDLASRVAALLCENVGWVGLAVTKLDVVPESDGPAAVESSVERLKSAVVERLRAAPLAAGADTESALLTLRDLEAFGVSSRQALRGKLGGDAALAERSGVARLETALIRLAASGREGAFGRIAQGALRAARVEIRRGFEAEASRRTRRRENLAAIYRSGLLVLEGLAGMAREELAKLDGIAAQARKDAMDLVKSLPKRVREAASRSLLETPTADRTRVEDGTLRFARRLTLSVDAAVSRLAEEIQIKVHQKRLAALDGLEAFAAAGDHLLDQIAAKVSSVEPRGLPRRTGIAARLRSLWLFDSHTEEGHEQNGRITLPSLAMSAGRIAACLAPGAWLPAPTPLEGAGQAAGSESSSRIDYASAVLAALEAELIRWRDQNAAHLDARLAIDFDIVKEELVEVLDLEQAWWMKACGAGEVAGNEAERAGVEEIIRRLGES